MASRRSRCRDRRSPRHARPSRRSARTRSGVRTSSQTSGGAPSSGLGMILSVTSGGVTMSSGDRMSRGRMTPVQMRLPLGRRRRPRWSRLLHPADVAEERPEAVGLAAAEPAASWVTGGSAVGDRLALPEAAAARIRLGVRAERREVEVGEDELRDRRRVGDHQALGHDRRGGLVVGLVGEGPSCRCRGSSRAACRRADRSAASEEPNRSGDRRPGVPGMVCSSVPEWVPMLAGGV